MTHKELEAKVKELEAKIEALEELVKQFALKGHTHPMSFGRRYSA